MHVHAAPAGVVQQSRHFTQNPYTSRRWILLLTEGSNRTVIAVTEGSASPLDHDHPGDALSRPQDLIQGTLDLLLLKMLALDSMNGWEISQRLKQFSRDTLQVSDGSLYPALHKLEQEGWIAAEWRQTENNRRAKFYSLTRAGKKQLRIETDNWDRLATAVTALVRLKEV
jgi:transcriptional regulator